MASTIVGLDIGNGVLRAAEIADPAKTRPALVRYHSLALPAGAVERGEVADKQLVSAALKQLWTTAGFKSKKVVLGMGNQRVLVRDVSVPKMPLPQIKESLPFQVQELLPVPVADALLDFYPISAGKSENGEVVNGLLVAAVKEAVLRNVEAVQLAGLDPVEVDLVPFALTRALLSGPEGAGTVALVHVGAQTTTVVVANDGVPQFVRIMSNGGDDVTAALVSKLGIDAERAEQVKRGLGLAPNGAADEWRAAVAVIAEATGDILDNVRNTLSFYINTRGGVQLARLVVSGGGAQMPGLPNALAESTRLPVTTADMLSQFSVARSFDTTKAQTEQSGLAVAAGLAMGSRA